jgi:5-formaminoimidazole-4-carboxamide-1-(beta)-D-ribofuranosyl 5'-monophosphate synthetase
MIISTLGSHSSLQILHGAKKEGFKTLNIVDTSRYDFYKNFNFIDEILIYRDLDEAVELINKNIDSIFIPHGSLIEYLGINRVSKIKTKIFGNKYIFPWESDQKKKCTY